MDCRGWHRSWGLGSPGRWYGLGLYLVDGGWCRRGRGLDCWSWGGWALGLSLGCCLCSALGGLLGPALCLVECLLAGLAPALDGRGRWPEVFGRLSVDALGLERAVIDAGLMACLGQGRIGQLCPALAPARDLCGAGRPVVQLAGLVAEAARPQAAGGAEDVGMVVALVAFFAWFVNGYVHSASVVLDQLCGKCVCQFLALRCG